MKMVYYFVIHHSTCSQTACKNNHRFTGMKMKENLKSNNVM